MQKKSNLKKNTNLRGAAKIRRNYENKRSCIKDYIDIGEILR